MGEEQYMLRWHYQETTLCRSFSSLLDNEILTDCTISVRHRKFKTHKLVLAACSTYFLDLFQNLGPSETPIVVLHDVNVEDVEAILSYIYKGQCLVNKTQVPRLIALAKGLRIQGLCNMKASDMLDRTIINDCDQTTTKCDKDSNNPVENNKLSEDFFVQDRKDDYPSCLLDYNSKKALKDSPEICKCFICGKYLSNQYNLRVHMETHKDTYYSCVSCPHVSKSRDALRKHVSYRHPEEYTSRKKKKTC